MLLREDYWKWMPDIIALDIRAGQGGNNTWPADITVLHERLEKDPNYQRVNVNKEQLYYTRNKTVDMDWYKQFLKSKTN